LVFYKQVPYFGVYRSQIEMEFTPEHDAFVLMAHFRSGTRNEDGEWIYSLRSCFDQFTERFPEFEVRYKSFARHKERIVAKFNEKHCICKGKSSGRPKTLTPEVVDDVRNRMEQSPTKPLRKLSAQTGKFKLFLKWLIVFIILIIKT